MSWVSFAWFLQSGPLSVPDDAPRWAAVGLALLALWGGARQLDRAREPRWLVWLAPLTAAVLSAGYVVYYLRGGPRIIDATAYYLQARTFAEGMLSIPLPEPEHAVIGRFMVRTHATSAAAVIFPPGYPAVLALGFLVGAPLAIGPLLGAALTWATIGLARVAAEGHDPKTRAVIVMFSALASVGCAALRYHTADTMSHGLAALCLTLALWAVLRLLTTASADWRVGVTFGASAGLLFAARPVSALAFAAVVGGPLLGAMARRRMRAATLVGALAGAALPVALWFVFQSHVTGRPFGTAQSVYYAVSDGPAGCFRYGFGEGIGCLGEHGTFVGHNLADGYGLVAAAKTTGRRLSLHVSDAMGFAPAFVAVVAGGVVAARHASLRLLPALVLAQWLAYAPFYFDGNYPGGGARMFAEVLPIEHVLAASTLGRWRWRSRTIPAPRAAAWLLGASLLGFGVHLGAQHGALREREGGRPMFVPSAAPSTGLVFVDTDHGFLLAYDPRHPDRVARWHGDALDRLRWLDAGRPPAFRYDHDFDGGPPRVTPLSLAAPQGRIEGESLWPPAAQRGLWAFPRHAASPCASGGRVLQLTPDLASAAAPPEVRLALPALDAGVDLYATLLPTPGEYYIKLAIYSEQEAVAAVSVGPSGAAPCVEAGPLSIPRGGPALRLGIESALPVGLDRLELRENR